MRRKNFLIQLGAIRSTDKAAPEAGFMGGPGAGNAAAQYRRSKHGSLEAGLTVNVATGHAGNLTRSIKAGNRFEISVQNAAAKVGFHPASGNI